MILRFKPDGDPKMLRHFIYADGAHNDALPEEAFIYRAGVTAIHAETQKIAIGRDVFDAKLPQARSDLQHACLIERIGSFHKFHIVQCGYSASEANTIYIERLAHPIHQSAHVRVGHSESHAYARHAVSFGKSTSDKQVGKALQPRNAVSLDGAWQIFVISFIQHYQHIRRDTLQKAQ